MYKDTREGLFQIFQTNTLLLQTFHYISTFDRFSSDFVKAPRHKHTPYEPKLFEERNPEERPPPISVASNE